jgi:rfaE bifunctional protein kinase chain/domain
VPTSDNPAVADTDPRARCARLARLLETFAGRKVVVVGDLVADHYIYGESQRVSREAPVLIVRFESSEVKLGGAGNAAANLRGLGARVTAVGLVGRDETGARVRDLCRRQRITLLSPRARGVATETKTRILAGGVNTRRQQMLRLDRGQQGPHPEELQRALAGLVREACKGADAVLISDYGAGVLSQPVIEEIRSAETGGVPVCVDSRYNLRAFTGLTLIKPNEPELEALTSMRVESDAALLRALRAARRVLAAKALVVTRGRTGMVLARDGKVEVFPAHGGLEAVDVTGAGDTVAATLAAGLAAAGALSDVVSLSNIAGALVVQKPGTATISVQELNAELLSLPPSP